MDFCKLDLPDIVFVGGKKRAGKDFLCDSLVRVAGFHKYHIVYPWLLKFCDRHGLSYADYESNKSQWRPQVQAEATEARNANPNCLVDGFRELLPTLPRPLCVTGVRFVNEAKLGAEVGALVVRVMCPDSVRRGRFIDAGESLGLLDDPFEAEVDRMPVDCEIHGMSTVRVQLECLENAYQWKRGRHREQIATRRIR
jgi:hypothetical protein